MGNAAGWGGLLPCGQKLMMGFAAARVGGSHGVYVEASARDRGPPVKNLRTRMRLETTGF